MKRYESSESSRGGMLFSEVLTIVFVVLKLCKVINWSWWWVLSPIWISLAIFCIILAFVLVKDRKDRW